MSAADDRYNRSARGKARARSYPDRKRDAGLFFLAHGPEERARLFAGR